MPHSIVEVYPPVPLDELIPAIANFSASPIQEKRALIRRLVKTHPIVNLAWTGSHRYRRARRLDHEQTRPTHIDEVIWRQDRPAAQGRANPEGFPVLYLADRPETALAEVAAENHRVVLADFELLPGRHIQVAPIGELTIIQRTGRGFLSGAASAALSNALNACKLDAAKSLLITDAFLLDCLGGSDDCYEVSSCVAMSIFDKLPTVTAVAFPSVRQNGALNFAVRTEDFWNKWGIRSVRCAHAIHLAYGHFKLAETRHVIGIKSSGTLCWSDAIEVENSVALLDPVWTRDP